VRKLVDYVCDQQDAPYWTDKWHISPYYATAHAIRVLADLPSGLAHRVSSRLHGSMEWLRQTQNADGSWGFYGVGTAEETAYALLGLAPLPGRELAPDDRARCAAGRRYLRNVLGGSTTSIHHAFPALWIDKCLYTPALVVRAAIEAAFQATHHRRLSTSFGTAAPREENSLVA
jgi:halimadienyl-diphosphate synthase